MEEQNNREAKEGWRFARSAARITEEMAGEDDRKHTSGGVFVAIDSNLGPVVGAEEGAIESIPGNEGRIAHARRIAYLLSLLSAFRGWSRNEVLLAAVLKRTRTKKHPWLIACDANMSPEKLEKNTFGFEKSKLYVMAPEGVSSCRSRSAKGEWVEKVFDCVVACSS